MKSRLTQSFVNSIKPNPDKPVWITDATTNNLKLYVGTSGKKVWYLYYRDADDKKASHKIGPADALTVAQARDMALDFISRLKRGESPQKKRSPATILLGDFLRRDYEPWVTVERRSGEKTLYLLRSFFRQFLDKPINELTVKVMENWRHEKMLAGIKAATCNRWLIALKAAFNWGVKREYLEANPLARLEKLPEHDSDPKVRYLTDDERKRLMAALEAREKRIRDERQSHNEWYLERGHGPVPDLIGEYADYLRPMVLISLYTGMRQGNLFALRWGDIDFETRSITLRASVSKSGKTLRVSINSAVVAILTSWREQSVDTDDEALVFPSPRSGGLLNNVKKSWTAVLKDARIENFRWHDMRHDFASQLVMKGVDLNTVRELMGHSDLKMTLRYAHLAPDSKLRAVELLMQEA